MTKRNRLLVVLAAVMAFALAAAFLLFSPPQTAFAERSSTAWTTIGEIYNDSTKAFNEDNLKKLYKALTGTDTFASVQTAADSGKTSADFRNQNVESNNVSVWFGGKKWDAVYLTTAQNGGGDTQKGDVILDLWQSADNIDKQKVGFLDWDAERTDVNDTYPANMYSTSTLRVKTLNAGGYCLTSKNTLGTKQEQDSNNQYARFTMSTVGNSLTKYIATPAEVGYQEHEFDGNSAADIANQVYKQQKQYYLPNDAYGEPNTGGEWYSTDYGNLYSNKDDSRVDGAKYGAWKDDYLWIPSITEAGCGVTGTGLWNTDFSLRSSAGTKGTDWTWFRSGYSSDQTYSNTGYYFFVFVLGVLDENNNHADWSNLTSTDPNFVRPALHLNLTAANKNTGSAWTTVGEIYNDGSSSFNRDNMQALYTALTGAGSYGDVRTALNGGNKTSADFREQNVGKNVQVTFGGIKWDAVYLTKAKNGDFILDLWQSADNVSETPSKYANRSSASDNPTASYPDNMYSTSLIRVQTLNAGGYMSTSGSALAEKTEQDANNKYARFTMSSADKSLVQYIVQPKDVAYQETESAVGNSGVSNICPNDAYGTPSSGNWFNDGKYNYTGKGTAYNETKYEAWKNDYLWLPSLAETGKSDTANQNGLWKTDASLRSTVATGGASYAWLRSGGSGYATFACYLTLSGGYDIGNVCTEYAVRPAIHLNLTAINNSLKKVVNAPEIKSLTYTGSNLKADISETTEYKIISNEGGVEVGTYDVELQLKSPDDYKWADEEPNKEFKLLKYEITTATNEWTGGGVSLDGWTYGDTPQSPSAPSKFGTATYTYYNDKNGVADTSPLGAQPTNAGTYWVKATVAALKSTKDPSKNNYDELVSAPVSFEIKKATLTIKSAEVKTKPYDGTTTVTINNITFDGIMTGDESKVLFDSCTAAFESANASDSATVNISAVTLKGEAAGNYTVDTSNLPTITGKIEKATATVTVSTPQNAIYDGTVQSATVSISVTSGAPELKESDYKVSYQGKVLTNKTPKNADTYTVTVTLTGNAAINYKISGSSTGNTTTAEFTVGRATVKSLPNLNKSTVTYNGDIQYASAINESFETGVNGETLKINDDYTVTYMVKGVITDPKNADTYTVTVALTNSANASNYTLEKNTAEYTIGKAQITVSGKYSDSRDYNGVKYEFKITDEGLFNGLTVEMNADDPEFEITIATDKSANTYTGNIKVEYDVVNFDLTNDGTYTVTINKAELTLTLTVVDGGKPYDGYDTATVTGEITADSIFGSDDVTIAEIIANFNDKNVGKNKPIKITQVTLGGTEAGNYTVVLKDLPAITGDIEQATIEVVWSGYTGLVYDGNSKAITASTTGVMINGKAEEVILSITYVSNTPGIELVGDIPLNAGSYTATASTSNGNYALSGNTKTYTVAKQQVAAPTIASKVYNRAPQTAYVEQSELYEVTENDGGTDVDNYNVKLTLTDSKNYAWTTSDEAEIVLTFTITKATYDMSGVTFEDFSIIYDGEEHSIFIGGALPFEEVTVRYENNGQTAVGEYTVTAIFEGDAHNYEPIPEKTATLTILKVVHNLSNIIFADVKVKYDGEAHGIYIEGELPTNVTVTYEGNGQTEPNIYTVTAVFSDPDGEFDRKTATLTILRTQTQTAPKEESSSGGSSSSSGSGETGGEGGSSGESGANAPEVLIESEEGFDPTLELVVEKVEDVERNYLAWGADEVSQKYAVKLYNRDGEEVPIEGKVTVRLLIPEAFREKDFDLMAMAKAGAASANDGVQTVAISAMTGATSVTFTRDGDYVVFEADGLSDYVFTSSYTPYFPIIIAATGVLLVDVAAMIALAVVIKKKLQRKAR